MTAWEYLHESHLDEPTLNKLGREGWELVNAALSPMGVWHLWFKRPIGEA